MAQGTPDPKNERKTQAVRDTAGAVTTFEDELGLLRVLSSIEQIRALAQEKRALLLQKGQNRVNRKKIIYVVSGLLALVSGGAASALVAPAADLFGVKLVAAGLAFASGGIALVTTAFFDEKETAKINEGAGRYGELRDRADVVLNSRNRNLGQIDTIYQRLTESQTQLQKEFDIHVDVETIQAKSNQILEELNSRLRRAEQEIRDRYGKNSAPGSAAGERGGAIGGGFPAASGLRLGPSFNTRLD